MAEEGYFLEMPYFYTNIEWYYYDYDEWKYKLTDKAPKEAIDSYIEFYSLNDNEP